MFEESPLVLSVLNVLLQRGQGTSVLDAEDATIDSIQVPQNE